MAGNRSGWGAVVATALALVLAPSPRVFALDRLLASGDTLADGTPVVAIRAYAIGAGGAIAARVQTGADTSAQAIVVRAGGRPWVAVVRTGVGAPGGGIVQTLGRVAVGVDGTAIVRADVQHADASTSGIVLACQPGVSCRRLVAVGDPTPGSGSHHFMTVDVPVASAGGIVFRGTDEAGGMGLYGVSTSGVVSSLVRTGDAMPGGGTFGTFGGPVMAADGTLVFFASGPMGGSTRKGLFRRFPSGGVEKIALVGDAAVPSGTFTQLQSPGIGDDGTVAFRGTRLGSDAQLHTGVFAIGGGGLRAVVQQNDLDPSGAVYLDFTVPAAGVDGLVVVRASEPDTTSAVVAFMPTATVLARSGDAAPAGGGTFASFDDPQTGPRHRLLFSATLEDGSTQLLATNVPDDVGPSTLAVDCSQGGTLAAALATIADQGTITVTGTCREAIRLDDDRRINLVAGGRTRRTRARLSAVDDVHPALDVRPTAGAASVVGFAVDTTAPLTVDGVGHVLQDLDVRGGGLVLSGSAIEVDQLRLRAAPGVCLSAGASDSRIAQTRALGCGGDGVTVSADRNVLDHVVVQHAQGRGAVVSSNGNTVQYCRFVGNRGTGLRVTGGGSTLIANRVLRNRGGGLLVQGCNRDGGHNRAAGNRGGPNREFQDCHP